MNLKELKEHALKNPEFKKEYERFDLFMEIGLLWTRMKMKLFLKWKELWCCHHLRPIWLVDEKGTKYYDGDECIKCGAEDHYMRKYRPAPSQETK